MQDTLLTKGTLFLQQQDSDWQQLIEAVGPCELILKAERTPYESLVQAVGYQQLHTKAGDAIMKKFLASFNDQFPTPTQLLATKFDTLRSCGFSGRKIETIQGIARGEIEKLVPSRQEAETLSNEDLISRLITLKGIGRWTVEMMLIFTLGRQDILPVNDLGIREGYKRLKQLDIAPQPKALNEIGKAWQPYRTIASWYLWRVPK